MTGDRIRALVSEVEARFPGTRVELRPYSDEEDPAIRWFLWILDVPTEWLCEAEDFAIGRAIELFRGGPLPCFVSAASPETTAKHFPAPAVSMPAGGWVETVWLSWPVLPAGGSRSLTAWNDLLRHTWTAAHILLAPGLWVLPTLVPWKSSSTPAFLDAALAWEGITSRERETVADSVELPLAA